MTKTHYQTLGVAENATVEEIKTAYRARVMACHPDRNGGAKASEDELKEVNAAYDTLHSPVKRAAYDEDLGRERLRAALDAAYKAAAAARGVATNRTPLVSASAMTAGPSRTTGLTVGQVAGGMALGFGVAFLLDALFGGSSGGSRGGPPRGPDGRFVRR